MKAVRFDKIKEAGDEFLNSVHFAPGVTKAEPDGSDLHVDQPIGDRKKKRKKPVRRNSVQHNGGNRLSKSFRHKDLMR